MAKGILGAQLYSVKDFCKTAVEIAETLKKIKAIGYTSIQVSGFGPVDYKEVAKVLADSGLIVAATHCGWGDFQTKLDEVIDKHKAWKCVHPAVGALPKEYKGQDGLKKFIDELTPIAEKLNAAGMDFSYHNHSGEFVKFDGKCYLEHLYERTSPKILKAEIDTYWIQHGGGDPAAWIRKLGRRQPLLHLKDMVIAEKEQRFAPVGEGNLNWPAIMSAAAEVGVEYYLVEQDMSYGADPFECLATSYRNLVKMGLK